MLLIMGNVSQLLSLYRYHCNNGPERFHYKKYACSFGYKRREKGRVGGRNTEGRTRQEERENRENKETEVDVRKNWATQGDGNRGVGL
jgi:hypothetical protein